MNEKPMYEVFGKLYRRDKAVAFSMKDIRDRSLRELYELFKTINNAHTDEETVVVHFLYDETNNRVDMLWTCSHFEAESVEDVAALLHFLLELRADMNIQSEVSVELLDAFAEKLIVSVSDVPFRFPRTPKDIKNLAIDYGE